MMSWPAGRAVMFGKDFDDKFRDAEPDGWRCAEKLGDSRNDAISGSASMLFNEVELGVALTLDPP